MVSLGLQKLTAKSETAKIKILDLPILTDRGTFIVQGKDYSVFNQSRLLPGVYTRRTNDSDAVFADFNLAKGLGFEIHMDTDGVFSVRFDKSKLSTSSKKILYIHCYMRWVHLILRSKLYGAMISLK